MEEAVVTVVFGLFVLAFSVLATFAVIGFLKLLHRLFCHSCGSERGFY